MSSTFTDLNQHCIFILAGQSNAAGFGHLDHLADLAAQTTPAAAEFQIYKNGTDWTLRDDVFVSFPNELGATRPFWVEGFLSADQFGSEWTKFGPEVGFGFSMGDGE